MVKKSVYCAEIKDITVGLDNYVGYSHNVNFLKDIKILKSKLENYRSDIKRARIDKNNETNTTFNINNSSTTNINNKINITLEQTIKIYLIFHLIFYRMMISKN